MSILRKLFAGISVLAMIAMVTPTSAITVEELTAQIAALTAQIAALQGTTTTTTGTSAITGVPAGFTFQTNLKLGSNNSDVVYLKKVLDVEVPTHSAWTGTPYFGTGTKAAVITFQEKYATEVLAPFGLTAGTGFVGASTRAKLNALLASGSTGTGTGTGTGTTVPTGTG
ncbi:MAG: peptidoglycan-binding domain-containing protein, partial [Candidatus Pacebacteria bacterium]|nr:peptidoglycan-binding domain-containing protein [Candidatus Paceibacterota bacterium]